MPDPTLNPALLSNPDDYLRAQRQQMLAQALTQEGFQSLQTPESRGAITPRIPALSGISKLAQLLAGNRLANQSNQAMGNIYSSMANQGQQFTQAATDRSRAYGERMAALDRGVRFGLIDPKMAEQIASQAAAENKPPELDSALRNSGIMPGTPEYADIMARVAKKASQYLQVVRPENTVLDLSGQQPNALYTAPKDGIQTTYQDGNPSQSTIPGSHAAQAGASAAKEAGTSSEQYFEIGSDAQGRKLYAKGRQMSGGSFFPQTASPAVVSGQEAGAKEGQKYSSDLAKNATGATEVRRSLAELRNLSSQATPSAFNEGKAKLGAYMIAAGASPDFVSRRLGVDPGVLQAASKQTATLAVNSIHSMTNRGTNFDLDTFMRNNPNLNMADSAGFNAVVSYMDKKASQDIAKQKDFTEWKQGRSPDEWEAGHTAHWLEKQNQDIDAGRYTSNPPTAQAGNTQLPQSAVRHLKEGANTEFQNGQIWTLKGGVPTRVK